MKTCLASLLLTGLLFAASCNYRPAGSAAPVPGSGKEKAAEACFQEGRAYARGEGKPRDPARAAAAFLQAAELGHAKAQNNYASLLLNGTGVEKNEAEAVRWFQKAAENGADLAQLTLGRLYEQGLAGQKQDPKQALGWYEKAAGQGNSEAQYRAAELWYFGAEGITRDYAKAASWAEKAAQGGQAAAENMLGSLKEEGLGCKKDLAEAALWYQKAADQGYAKAQANLGRMHLGGQGVEKNFNKAFALLVQSAEQHEVSAVRLLQDLARGPSLTPELKARAEALVAAYESQTVPAKIAKQPEKR